MPDILDPTDGGRIRFDEGDRFFFKANREAVLMPTINGEILIPQGESNRFILTSFGWALDEERTKPKTPKVVEA